jgi:DNA-binding MarR family transcriptional regulator
VGTRERSDQHPSATDGEEVDALRTVLQTFVRKFGLLVTNQTPCGLPVSPSYAHALMVLAARRKEGLTTSQSDLGEALGIDKSNVARLSARLVDASHVLQEAPEHDARARHLTLTAAGSRLARRLDEASRDRLSRIALQLTPVERRQLFQSFERLNAAIQVLEEEDQP